MNTARCDEPILLHCNSNHKNSLIFAPHSTEAMSGSGDLPALEGPGMGGMKLPIGMTRRALSYDDNLEAPMSTPPHDINITNLWRRPVVPERKFNLLAEEDEGVTACQSNMLEGAPSRSTSVVKTKASSLILNSLITKQTHDSMYKFEQKAGLSDTGYTPHKGLTAEETKYHHRMPESFQKMQLQSLEAREERQNSSAQSTPSTTPHTSPKQQRRSWFNSTSSDVSVSSSNSSVDLVGGDGGGGGGMLERWGTFGPRPLAHKSTSDLGGDPSTQGFALQAYRGAHKPSAAEVMKSQATGRLADVPDAQRAAAPPKMEIPTVDGRRQAARPHKLKPRDMNVLTPSGF
ncbi:putative monooxygenase p33MONOX isoform X2 [Hippocampus zosterae]|uniref:putative monooxygenase p33MONOX isoform X2 n=1 Tax=Hippocampus zosterae TaxID=109293 RepID=UPI00223CCE45|nr:putative monooxygenase p33MONOX isoform X2 [Hippocampus zosterae]